MFDKGFIGPQKERQESRQHRDTKAHERKTLMQGFGGVRFECWGPGGYEGVI